MSDSSNDFGAFLTGFVIGGLAGAAVSLLMAPQSGEETREQIVTRGIEIRDRADDELRSFRARADETLNDLRVQAEEIQAKTMAQLDDARTKLNSAVEQGTGTAKKVRDDLTSKNKNNTSEA